jgi:hypothetical protein
VGFDLLDDFQRVDQCPPSVNWTDDEGGLCILNLQCIGLNGGAINRGHWNVEQFGPDMGAACIISEIPGEGYGDGWIKLLLRYNPITGAAYTARWFHDADGNDTIDLLIEGGGSLGQVFVPMVAGAILLFTASGHSLTVSYKSGDPELVLVITATDDTIQGAGYIGVEILGAGAVGGTLDPEPSGPGVYSVSRSDVACDVAADLMTLVAPTTGRVKVIEIGITGMEASRAANELIVARSSDGIAGGGMLTPGKTVSDQASARSSVYTTWDTQPTLGDVLLRLPVNADGGVARWRAGRRRPPIELRPLPIEVAYDEFDRADGELGVNWTMGVISGQSPTADLHVISSQVGTNNPAGQYSAAYYNVRQFRRDCMVYLLASTLFNASVREIAVFARLGDFAGGFAYRGYCLVYDALYQYVSLSRLQGVFGGLVLHQASYVMADGDTLELDCIGRTFTAIHYPSVGDPIEVFTHEDTDMDACLLGGYAGMGIGEEDTAIGQVRVDDFAAMSVPAGECLSVRAAVGVSHVSGYMLFEEQ